jgi:ubiquinone/menaquinone biosynthesis C-methylase UbiE
LKFAVSAPAYDRFMGRYSRPLAPLLADFAGIEAGLCVADVGCGPGALTAELARRVGPEHVAAADPASGFAAACAERFTGADVRTAPAEKLPWPAESFDAVLSQLVINFLRDADAGVREMRRVARHGATLASCTWDYGGEMEMLRTFWDAALTLAPAAPDEARSMGYGDPDSLRELWLRSELHEVKTTELRVNVDYTGFDDFWQPFLTGTGPAGAYCVSLEADHQAALREECWRRLGAPPRPFTLSARAWAVRGVA